MSIQSVTIVIIFFVMSVASVEAYASQRLLKVGIYQYKPFSYYTDNNVPRGFFVDILEDIAEENSWELHYVTDSWSVILQRLISGEIDVLLAVPYKSGAEENIIFSRENIFTDWSALCALDDANIENFQDLYNKRIAIPKYARYVKSFKDIINCSGVAITCIEADSPQKVCELIKQKKVDAGILNRVSYLLYDNGSSLKRTPMIFNPIPIRFAYSRYIDEDIIKSIDNYLAKKRKDNPLFFSQQLEGRYGAVSPLFTKYPWLCWLVSGTVVFLAVFIVYSILLSRQVKRKTSDLNDINRELKYRERELALKNQQLLVKQKELRSAQENCRLIFNSIDDAVMIHDIHDGRVVDVNKKVLELFGYEYNEIISLGIDDLSSGVAPYTKDDANRWIDKAVREGPQRLEWYSRKKTGEFFWTEVVLDFIKISGNDRILVTLRDITDRKSTEEELTQLNETLEKRVNERTEALRVANQQLLGAKMEVQATNQQLVANNEELEYKNKELVRKEDELRAIVKDLHVANKEQEDFAYSIAHDLRSPLRGISGFCQILEDDYGKLLDDRGRDYLSRIYAATDRLRLLISALLDLSRMVRFKLKVKRTNLELVAERVIETFYAKEPYRNVSVTIDPNMIVDCDEQLMQVALGHLVQNAWKFTASKKKAEIHIGMKSNEKQIFFVSDNGSGFEMAYRDKLFKPFQRLHSPDEFEGVGIGLAITAKIVEKHGGTIWAESEVGKGSTFYFTLG